MHYTKAEVEAIRVLIPHYKTALLSREKEAVEDFFERAYLVWFDYCPNVRSIDTDAEEWAFILEKKRRVSTTPFIDVYSDWELTWTHSMFVMLFVGVFGTFQGGSGLVALLVFVALALNRLMYYSY